MTKTINTQPKGFPPVPENWQTEYSAYDLDGFKLFYSLHTAQNSEIKNIFVICHGFGEHGGRYEHFPYYLKSHVDAVFVHDHRGHGRSQGQRGHADHFDQLVSDQLFVLKQIQNRFQNAKIHFFAHSMGGHVGLRLALLNPDFKFSSFQVSSPFLGLKYPISIIKRGAARLLSRVWGSLSLSESFDAAVLSRDPYVVEHYNKDKLNHNCMTPRFYTTMTECWKDTLSRKKGIEPPFQMLLPQADVLVDGEVSRRFFENLEHYQKNLVLFDEMRHEGFNDYGKEKFFQSVTEWIQKYS